MKFINPKYVAADWVSFAEENNGVINVRFCRTCPLFEPDRIQYDPSITRGWCRRMSYYEPILDNELPHYVYVNSNSFCNEDDIGNEDDY